MPGLKFDQIKDNQDLRPEFEKVEVAEFGADDEGDPYYVNVRGFTVYEWGRVVLNAREYTPTKNGDMPDLSGSFDEVCQVAGMVSYDDDHRLVFGTDWLEATALLQSLHVKYRPALIRIHQKAVDLSGFGAQIEKTIEKNKKKSAKTR